MKADISQLQAEILQLLSRAVADSRIDEITRLSSMVSRTKDLAVAADRIFTEVQNIRTQLLPMAAKAATPPNGHSIKPAKAEPLWEGRRDVSTLEVRINWSANGQPYGTETIREHFASETLMKLMQRLTAVLGVKALDVASKLIVNRGPFVSRNPEVDYRNKATGALYFSHEIPGTEYRVLTHSATDQKVEDVKQLLQQLGMVPGSYSVKKIPRGTEVQ
jgi:hypothetical protein